MKTQIKTGNVGKNKLTNAYSITIPTRRKNPDSMIDTSRLLFKPVSLPQIPPTRPLTLVPEWSRQTSLFKDVDLSREEHNVWEKLTEHLDAVAPQGQPASLTSSVTTTTQRRKNPDSMIDMSGLLFKPVSLPQIPSTRPLTPVPEWSRQAPVLVDVDLSPEGWEVWEKPTERLEAVAPQGWDPHFSSGLAVSQDKLNMLTLARPTTLQGKKHAGSLGELMWCVLGTGVVVTLYMITPLATTLIPILPGDWSRLLIALELLGVGEFAICRILMKTTRK
jgi:hypothetical protein